VTPNCQSPTVAAVIINYNGRAFLDELLDSLLRQTRPADEIWLIDNGSSDQSPAYVLSNYKSVRVVALDANFGFSRAANLGVFRAQARYTVLLNPDVKLDERWIEELTACAEADPAIAAAASKLRLYRQPDLLNGVGGAMNRLGYTWDRGMFEPDHGQWDHPAEVLFACAGAALFRKQAFCDAGGFDEAFFMYHEDVDLCWRFWLLGGKVVTAPSAVAYHHFGGATKRTQGMLWRELMGERHNIRTLVKNYEGRNLARALRDLLLLRQSPKRKWAQLLNFAWNLRRLRDTLRRRARIQRRRVRRDTDLERLIVQSPHVPIRL
jgi:GT2 family glycosyltransferase